MLPIHELSDSLRDALSRRPRVVLQAPTGSGKSTQVPQMLLDHPKLPAGRILVLQPRRMAARMLASRVAQERRCNLGDEVGYQIRFDDRSSHRTRIQYITEGILLRRLLRDPTLKATAAVLFDEFHERNLYTDLSLARVKQLQTEARPDLLMVVMSATLHTDPVAAYLDPCEVLVSEGRTFPVDISYLSGSKANNARKPVWDKAADAFGAAVARGAEGDALIFMPGAYEIQRTVEAIRRSKVGKACAVLPLHGEMAGADQDRVLARCDRRKVVISTNVAETSLTIDGIRLVIDSGQARMARFDPYRGVSSLTLARISKASADQRAGRAGRTAPGRCIRLWSEKSHSHREDETLPEIRRVDLAETLLNLAAQGVEDLEKFPWYEAPDPKGFEAATELLHGLGALDDEGRISGLGKLMAEFPLPPRYARMLLEAGKHGCVREIALVAAMAQERNFVLRRLPRSVEQAQQQRFGGDRLRSDFTFLIRAWRYAAQQRFDLDACRDVGLHAQAARQIGQTRQQILSMAERLGLPTDAESASEESLAICLLIGLVDQLALRRDKGTNRCLLSGGRKGTLAKESWVSHAPFFVSAELREIERHGKDLAVELALNTAVERGWLDEFFPSDFRTVMETHYDTTSRRVVCRREKRFRDLVLESKPGDDPSKEEAAQLLAREVKVGNLKLKKWDKKVEAWICRVNCLARHLPELQIEEIQEEDRQLLLEQLCLGAFSFRELRDRNPWPVLRSWLSPEQLQSLDYFAPERIELPRGKTAKVMYPEEGHPLVSARIQELYDVESLSIADGKIPCRIELLAPNFRPVQIADDLKTFWAEGYPLVRKELAGRYPKHEWR